MRDDLETLKALVDEIYAKEPAQWRGAKSMMLHPPASDTAVAKFFASAPGKDLPRSYADLLRASDGLENGWQRLSFLGTAKGRQKPIAETMKYKIDDQVARFEAYEGKPDDKKIKAWEAKADRLFLSRHAIAAAATPEGDLLVYDVHTRRKDGEMELCWWPGGGQIVARYPNIAAYVKAALVEAKRHHAKLKKSRGKK